jgi:hypothetical protein
MFRKFYLFNCSSPQVSAFEAGRVTCCVIGENWLVNCSTYFSLTLCSFQPGRRIAVLGSVSWLGNLALPELGTAQPQLVLTFSCIFAKLSPSFKSSLA